MAEYYFNSKNLVGITAESCGLRAEPGGFMSANAKKVLESNGILANGHISRQIDAKLAKEADIIYGITKHHEARLKEEFPDFKEKISSMPEDVGDPYGGSLEAYEECFGKIKKSVDIIIRNLTERN